MRERPDTLCNFVEIPLSEIEDGNGSSGARSRSSKGKQRMTTMMQQQQSNGDYSHHQEEEVLRVIYRHYATLYFVFCVDEAESELGILDLIQVRDPSFDLTEAF